jgi:hypothetical protein
MMRRRYGADVTMAASVAEALDRRSILVTVRRSMSP